jgi:DNA-binding NtrC family response regulator
MAGDPRLIAVVDDDPMTLNLIESWLGDEGYRALSFTEGRSFLREPLQPAVTCLDLGLGDTSGFEVLDALRARGESTPVIVLAAGGGRESAVQAMRAGAYDFVAKPLDREQLIIAIRRAVERGQMANDLRRLREELSDRHVLDGIVGRSPPMQELARQVRRVLDHDVTVTLLGELGTGKELIARAIHYTGPRAEGPFVSINCAAVPESLHEVELFGALTGASDMVASRGRFEMAQGGTLFLDEIAGLSALTQASLLRVLRDGRIPKSGSDEKLENDARIVCATHRDLLGEVRAGRFREDLYFQLVVHPLHVPALRDRREDVPLLVEHFLKKYQLDRSVVSVASEAMRVLVEYDWPGNVRELEDVVHRSLLAAVGETIELAHLPTHVLPSSMDPVTPTDDLPGLAPDAIIPMRELERRAIKRALRATDGSVEKAAKLLGMGRATLYRRLAHYEGIEHSGG